MTKHINLSSLNALKGLLNFIRDVTKSKLSFIQKHVLLASSEHYENFNDLKLAADTAGSENRNIEIDLDKLKPLFEKNVIDSDELSTFLSNIGKFDWTNYLEALNYLRSDKNNDVVFELVVEIPEPFSSCFIVPSFKIYTESYRLQGNISNKNIKKFKLSRHSNLHPKHCITLSALNTKNYSERLLKVLKRKDVKELVDLLIVSHSLDEAVETAGFAPVFTYPEQYSMMLYSSDSFPEEWEGGDGSANFLNEILDDNFSIGFLFDCSAESLIDYLCSNNNL